MALAKVTIEALTQMANTLRQSADVILATKEQMDSELRSFPWEDPIGLSFDKVTNTDVVAFFMHEYEHKQQFNRYKRGEISKKVFVHYPIETNDEKYLCNWKEVAARKYERFTCDTIEGCNDWHKDYLTKADSICEQ